MLTAYALASVPVYIRIFFHVFCLAVGNWCSMEVKQPDYFVLLFPGLSSVWLIWCWWIKSLPSLLLKTWVQKYVKTLASLVISLWTTFCLQSIDNTARVVRGVILQWCFHTTTVLGKCKYTARNSPQNAFPNIMYFFWETVINKSSKSHSRSYVYMSGQTIPFKVDLTFQVEWIIL